MNDTQEILIAVKLPKGSEYSGLQVATVPGKLLRWRIIEQGDSPTQSVPRNLTPTMRELLLRADEFTVDEMWTMLLAAAPHPAPSEAAAVDVLRDGVSVIVGCARAYLDAVGALGKIVDGKTLFEHSPSKNAECCEAWFALNDSGARLRECISTLEQIALTTPQPPAAPDYDPDSECPHGNWILSDCKKCEAERAIEQPAAPERPEYDDLPTRLTGRARFLRELNEVKTPELLEAAAAALKAPERLAADMLTLLQRISGIPIFDGRCNFGDTKDWVVLRDYFESLAPAHPEPAPVMCKTIAPNSESIVGNTSQYSSDVLSTPPSSTEPARAVPDDLVCIGSVLIGLDGAGEKFTYSYSIHAEEFPQAGRHPIYTKTKDAQLYEVLSGCKVHDIGFVWVDRKCIPTLVLGFAEDDWNSRDKLAALLATPPSTKEG